MFYVILILGILVFSFGSILMTIETLLGSWGQGDSIFWHAVIVLLIGVSLISVDLWSHARGSVSIQFKVT